MASPELELQGVVVSRLKADATLTGLIAGRIYDDAPAAATFPYLTIGSIDMVSDDADCIEGGEISFQIDVWARSGGGASARAQALRIADAVRASLRDESIALTANALAFLEHRFTRTFRDPDGLTMHSAIQFAAVVEQP